MLKKRILSLVLALATLFTCCVLPTAAVAETGGVATMAAQLATPKITSVSGAAGSVTIKWGAVSGAEKYRVFYKGTDGWKKIADTTSTSYTWNAPSGTYTFTVRCVSADGSTFTSDYDTTGTTYKVQLATPKITSVSGGAGSVKITWGAVTGAAKYRVFYKGTDGWKKIADTTSTSYTWTGAAAGKSYTFTVRCVTSDGSTFTSDYDTTGTTYNVQLATPKISSVSGGAGSVTIKWGAVSGAEKYRVFYKGTDGWKKIADTTSTSYTWTGAAAGKSYTFTVRCVSEDGSTFTSDYDTTGTTYNVQLATPKITGVSGGAGSVKITWGAVSGAAKYRVFYKGDTGWKKIADTTSTSYTWTGAAANTKYTFTVRCVSEDGNTFTSDYDTTGTTYTTQLATPKISSVTGGAGNVKITWGAVSGAAKYRVFYKGDTGWKKIADTTSTSYIWTGAAANTKYTFTVRCVSEDGSTFTSDFDTTGTSFTVSAGLSTPQLSSVVGSSNGVTIKWDAVNGAAKYRVFYKGSDGWKKIADTTATSYTWSGAKTGTKYTFTVRCVSEDGSTFTSDYDTAGMSITYLATPKLTTVQKVDDGIQISWDAVSGAEKYRIFYKTASSGWTELGDTTYTGVVWTNPKDATKYTFTVRCVTADGQTYTSGYDATGKSLTYYIVDAPTNFKASYHNGDIRLTWNSVSNALYYLVVYQVGNYDINATNWQSIDWTYSTYMDVAGATPGVTYTFVVVAVDSYGNTSPYAHYTYTHK